METSFTTLEDSSKASICPNPVGLFFEDSSKTVTTKSQISSLGITSPDLYRTGHGEFHRKLKKPRVEIKTDWFKIFRQIVCHENADDMFGKSIPVASSLVTEYYQLNGNPKMKDQADGMIKTFIGLGCSEDCLRAVLKIGYGRYDRINKSLEPATHVGRNHRAFGDESVDQLHRFVQFLPCEEGYPCGHRAIKRYLTDESVSSLEKLYIKYYKPFENELVNLRKMSLSSFKDFLKAYHPEFRLVRLKEDACDTCIALNTKLKDPSISLEEKESIKNALAEHGAQVMHIFH